MLLSAGTNNLINRPFLTCSLAHRVASKFFELDVRLARLKGWMRAVGAARRLFNCQLHRQRHEVLPGN